MDHSIRLDGFEGRTLAVESPGIFTGPRLLVDGIPAEKGPRRGQFLLRRNDGRQVVANWKPKFMGLDFPQLEIDGKLFDVVAPLKWYAWAWSVLPLCLIFIGGALGGFIGAIGFMTNAKIFRSETNLVWKFFITAGVSFMSFLVYLIAALAITNAIHR